MFNGEISTEVFLRDYWQQKPLVIRNALPQIEPPITANELAGLACESDVNSRLIKQLDKKPFWSVDYGPFESSIFENLPTKNWTLLVSDVEKHVIEGRELLNLFRFIPDWRIDDLMISYAVEGGSVGPHIDAYDVFLVQVKGQRRWQINTAPFDEGAPYLEGIDLRILKQFEADSEWVLDPGDILYLPPNIAHHGVAENECMTCSVGFRAPSTHALVSEFAETIASNLPQHFRYSDKNITRQQHPAEITKETLENIKAILSENMTLDNTIIQKWFGEFITSDGTDNHIDNAEIIYNDLTFLKSNELIFHSMHSKFLFSQENDQAILFVDGKSFVTSLMFAKHICESFQINTKHLLQLCTGEREKTVLLNLFNDGYLICDYET